MDELDFIELNSWPSRYYQCNIPSWTTVITSRIHHFRKCNSLVHGTIALWSPHTKCSHPTLKMIRSLSMLIYCCMLYYKVMVWFHFRYWRDMSWYRGWFEICIPSQSSNPIYHSEEASILHRSLEFDLLGQYNRNSLYAIRINRVSQYHQESPSVMVVTSPIYGTTRSFNASWTVVGQLTSYMEREDHHLEVGIFSNLIQANWIWWTETMCKGRG